MISTLYASCTNDSPIPVIGESQRFNECDVRAKVHELVPIAMKLTRKGWNNRHWYQNTTQVMKDLFPNDWVHLAGCLAVTSPQCHVLLNVKRAYSVMRYGVHGLNRPGMATPYTVKRATAKYTATGEISGIKTYAFYRNLIGALDDVTIDTWIFQAFGLKQTSHRNLSWHSVDRTIRTVASAMNLQPAECQAALWYGIMKQSGRVSVPQMSTFLAQEYPSWFLFGTD